MEKPEKGINYVDREDIFLHNFNLKLKDGQEVDFTAY